MCLQYMGTIKPSERDPSLLPTVEAVPVADAAITAPRHLDVHLPVRIRSSDQKGRTRIVLYLEVPSGIKIAPRILLDLVCSRYSGLGRTPPGVGLRVVSGGDYYPRPPPP